MVSRVSRFTLYLLLGMVLASFIADGGCAVITGENGVNQTPESQIFDVTAAKAFEIIQENAGNPDFIIIDVRTPEEYQEGHIESAVNLDFNSEDFRVQMESLDKDKTYLVYCRTGRRSSGARDLMAELNFKEVYHMSGGISDWATSGLPVVR